MGLLAGANDMQLLAASGVGRDINRRHYDRAAIESALARPVVQKLFDIIRLRNTHPAFDGSFSVLASAPHEIKLQWTKDAAWARLEVDFKARRFQLDSSQAL